jgi:hypothetical protein
VPANTFVKAIGSALASNPSLVTAGIASGTALAGRNSSTGRTGAFIPGATLGSLLNAGSGTTLGQGFILSESGLPIASANDTSLLGEPRPARAAAEARWAQLPHASADIVEMTTPPAAPAPTAPGAPAGFWARFARRHLFDYNATATGLLLLLAAGGALSAAWAGWQIATFPVAALLQVVVGIGFVVVAALFPVHIPRTKYSFGVANIFVFGRLAPHGAPAAALAAGADGIVGALRTAKRLTSHVSTPATATLAMTLWGPGAIAVCRRRGAGGVS